MSRLLARCSRAVIAADADRDVRWTVAQLGSCWNDSEKRFGQLLFVDDTRL